MMSKNYSILFYCIKKSFISSHMKEEKNMNIQKIIALIILLSGIILLVYGFVESNQVSLITGIVLIVITILDYNKLKNKKK